MKKVLINVEERELRVAILEDEQLVELYIESLDEKSILNNIYKGRIEGILPGLKAAFVNIGLERNAFLHFDDVRADLIWDKYKQLNPEIEVEIPTQESISSADTDAEDDLEISADSSTIEESEDSRDEASQKRRRGKRGGKKHRRDTDDIYTPGLPVGITEDDLDEDIDEESSYPATPLPSDFSEQTAEVEYDFTPAEHSEIDGDSSESDDAYVATPEEATDEQKPVRLTRAERNRLRRERWELKKQERRARRQEQMAASGETAAPQNVPAAPVETEELQPQTNAVSGTRGAHTPNNYDAYSPYNNGSQKNGKNNRQKGGRQQNWGDADNFGNHFPAQRRGYDSRDSQEDFFGPVSSNREEEYSVWDDRQPESNQSYGFALLPEKAQHPKVTTQANNNRNNFQRNNNNRNQHSNHNNKKKRPFNNNNRNRQMKRRSNNSYYAAKATDDLEDKLILSEEPKKKTPATRTRKKKSEVEQLALLPSVDQVEEKPKKSRTKKVVETTEASPAVEKAEKAPVKKRATAKKKVVEETTPTVAAEEAKDSKAEEKAVKKPAAKRTVRKKTTTKTVETAPEAVAETSSETVEKQSPSNIPSEVSSEPSVPPAPPVAEAPSAEQSSSSEVSSPAISEEKSHHHSSDRQSRQSRFSKRSQRNFRDRQKGQSIGSNDSSNQDNSSAAIASENVSPTETSVAPTAVSTTGEINAAGENTSTVSEQQQSGPQIRILPPITPHNRNQRNKFQNNKHNKHNKFQQGNQKNFSNNHKTNRRPRMPSFPEVYKKGDEVMVQVVKEEIGMKGARISTYVSLPGRYLVLLPYANETGGISRKVEDIAERKRLKTLLKDISTEKTGFIVRTAGIYRAEDEIREDVQFLNQEWKQIDQKHNESAPATLVYDDHNILYRLARDVFDENIGEILIDSHTECEKLKGILGKLIPSLTDKVKLYSGPENIFHKFQVEKQIQKAARRKVWLKSGGYLIIDEAEALTAIDVNTGKSVGKDDQEKLILKTNLEAARAVARELKLRDIGGLIVIDFIDMKDPRNRDQVLTELKNQLRKDRSKTSVSSISEFGLVEMTRKRVRRSLRKTIFTDCPYCQGAGVILNEQQIWLHIKHELVRVLEASHPSGISLTVNPKIRAYIDQNYKDVFRRLEQKYETEITISISDVFHMENYQIDPVERSNA